MSDPLSDPNTNSLPTDHDAQEAPAGSGARPDDSSVHAKSDPYEGAVPPGYDWPTHGGYLGCLLGLMAACLVGAFAGQFVELFTYGHHITGAPSVLLILATILVAVLALGRVGWLLGRRFYREYAVKPTWGEDDTFRPEWDVQHEAGANDTGDPVDAGAEEVAATPEGESEPTIEAPREPLEEDAPVNHGA